MPFDRLRARARSAERQFPIATAHMAEHVAGAAVEVRLDAASPKPVPNPTGRRYRRARRRAIRRRRRAPAPSGLAPLPEPERTARERAPARRRPRPDCGGPAEQAHRHRPVRSARSASSDSSSTSPSTSGGAVGDQHRGDRPACRAAARAGRTTASPAEPSGHGIGAADRDRLPGQERMLAVNAHGSESAGRDPRLDNTPFTSSSDGAHPRGSVQSSVVGVCVRPQLWE